MRFVPSLKSSVGLYRGDSHHRLHLDGGRTAAVGHIHIGHLAIQQPHGATGQIGRGDMALVVGHIAHHFGVYTHHGGTPVAVVGLVAHEHNTLAPRLSEVPVERISEFEQELFEYLTVQQSAIPAEIRSTKVLTKENEAELRQAIEVCKERFIKK